MLIYRDNNVIHDVKATDNSYRDFAIMGADIVVLEFYSETELDLQAGDYLYAFAERYSLIELPVPALEKGVYHYNLKFFGNYKELEKVKVFLYDTARDLTQSDFSYTCTPYELLQLLVNNMNAVQSHPWAVGEVIEGDVKTITISNQNCLEVLSNAASLWETEYYLTNFTIHLKKRSVDRSQTFDLTTGLASVVTEKDTGQRSITRLYAFGGTKNLPAGYSASRLQMPVPYIDQPAIEIIEDVKVFDDIFPRRLGTISAVREDENGIYFFTDSGLTFNPNDLQVAGLAKHIIFQSGQLIGLDFECNFHDSTSEFEIIRYQESGGLELPTAPLIPAVGDTYIIYNIEMPASYVTAAEAELQAAAQAYFNENVNDKLSFNLTFDEVHFTRNNLTISPGEMITIQNPYIEVMKAGLNIRVTAFKCYINKPNKFDAVKVSDSVYVNPLQTVQNSVTTIEKVLKKTGINAPQYAAKNWRDIAEITNMIDSVQTELLLVGNKQGQFTLQDIRFMPNAGGNPNNFNATEGYLVHRTIPEDNPGTWYIADDSFILSDTTKAYYFYAKCPRDPANAGAFITSLSLITYDSDSNYYYFLVGIISSVSRNTRSFQTVYGFTEIAGNEITTGIIKSADGKNYFDIDNNVIAGAVKFLAADGLTYQDMSAKQDAEINGQTLISGGYINTDFIDVKNLIAQILQTKATGARVEVNGISNSVIIYDSANQAKIVISPKAVMSIADIAGSNSISVTYASRSGIQSSAGSSILNTPEEITISDNKVYNISTPEITYDLSIIPNSGKYQSASILVLLKETVSGNSTFIFSDSISAYGQEPPVNQSKSGTIAIKTFAGMTSGTYKIEVTMTLTGEGIGSSGSSIASGQTLEADALISYQEVGTDGFNFINSATDYVHNSADEFVVRKGNQVLEITSSAVKINGITQVGD